MRAYLHDGQEPHALHPKAGYIGARPNYSILTDFSCNAPPVHTFGVKQLSQPPPRSLAGTSAYPPKPDAVVGADGSEGNLQNARMAGRPIRLTFSRFGRERCELCEAPRARWWPPKRGHSG